MNLSIYTDGSWSKGDQLKTYGGVVIVNDDGEVVSICRCFSSQEYLVAGRNHGGELLAAMCGIQLGVSHLCGKDGRLTVYHDYKGVSAFVNEWSPKSTWKLSSKVYYNIILHIQETYPEIKIEFNKVTAHSGNKWNELADSVANGFVPAEYRDRELEMMEL